MKLKIISDGTPKGTKVVDEMGNRVEYVQSVQWSVKVGELSRATIEILDIPIETAVLNGKRQVRKRYIRCLGDTKEEETDEGPAEVKEVADFIGSKLKEKHAHNFLEDEEG
jgi:hypothetical protein